LHESTPFAGVQSFMTAMRVSNDAPLQSENV